MSDIYLFGRSSEKYPLCIYIGYGILSLYVYRISLDDDHVSHEIHDHHPEISNEIHDHHPEISHEIHDHHPEISDDIHDLP
jgi:hypothetical protein